MYFQINKIETNVSTNSIMSICKGACDGNRGEWYRFHLSAGIIGPDGESVTLYPEGR